MMKEQELVALVQGWQEDEPHATQILMGMAYHKIKELAEKHHEKMPNNANTAVLSQSATDLAHDVYIRLSNAESTLPINTLREFYSYLNATVRNAFIDNYRKLVQTRSRNPDRTRLTSLDAIAQTSEDVDDSMEFSSLAIQIEALSKQFDRQAETLELRYYAGRPNKEIARLQNVSLRTVENDLRFAKAWIKQRL